MKQNWVARHNPFTGDEKMERDHLEKERVKQQFARTAEQYVTSESHAQGDDLQAIVDWTKPQPNWHVLDIATGGGHVAKTLAPYVHHVMATDITPRMLEVAAQHLASEGHHNVSYVLADAEALPFLADSFDLVTCRIAPHHFPHPESFVREVARVLKPDGIFVMIDNTAPEDPDLAEFLNTVEKMRDPSHVRSHSISAWKHWFAQHSLEILASRARRKTYRLPQWLERAVESEEQKQRVIRYLLQADSRTKSYFSIQIAGQPEQVESMEVEEWMVMACKREA
jgi:ubiquinone/menaquinone biosynthesis C-methylase UbiE